MFLTQRILVDLRRKYPSVRTRTHAPVLLSLRLRVYVHLLVRLDSFHSGRGTSGGNPTTCSHTHLTSLERVRVCRRNLCLSEDSAVATGGAISGHRLETSSSSSTTSKVNSS